MQEFQHRSPHDLAKHNRDFFALLIFSEIEHPEAALKKAESAFEFAVKERNDQGAAAILHYVEAAARELEAQELGLANNELRARRHDRSFGIKRIFSIYTELVKLLPADITVTARESLGNRVINKPAVALPETRKTMWETAALHFAQAKEETEWQDAIRFLATSTKCRDINYEQVEMAAKILKPYLRIVSLQRTAETILFAEDLNKGFEGNLFDIPFTPHPLVDVLAEHWHKMRKGRDFLQDLKDALERGIEERHPFLRPQK